MLSSMDTRIPTSEEINAMTDQECKVLENRLRRAADRQGLRLVKNRARDPRALLYGTYMLVDVQTGGAVYADWALQRGYGLDLKDVAGYLFAGSVCHRCLRPAPNEDDPEYLYWEALDDGTFIVCPDCITPEEQQAMDESDRELMDEIATERRAKRGASS